MNRLIVEIIKGSITKKIIK